MLSTAFNDEELKEALKTARSSSVDVRSISKVVPRIVTEENSDAAHQLLTTCSGNRDHWLPEAMSIFNTPGLSVQQRTDMVESLFSPDVSLNEDEAISLANCTASIGRLGFSFPQWRFVSQGLGEASLLENFGMQRLQRDNDVRDSSLPPYDPNRDQYGVGFVWNKDEWTVEYRRSYVVCSNSSEANSATFIIRNNSYFYGRDRLPSPFYVSWEPISSQDLQRLDEDMLLNSGLFSCWQDCLNSHGEIPTAEKTRRAQNVLNFIDDFDARLSLWLRSAEPLKDTSGFDAINSSLGKEGGLDYLLQFLTLALSKHRERGKSTPAFYVTEIDSDMPPWVTNKAYPVDEKLLADIQAYKSKKSMDDGELEELFLSGSDADMKMILLTGPDGDFPLKPQPKTEIKAGEPAP